MFYYWYTLFCKKFITFSKNAQKVSKPVGLFLCFFIRRTGCAAVVTVTSKKILDYKNYNPKSIGLVGFFILALAASLVLGGVSVFDHDKLLASTGTIVEAVDFNKQAPLVKKASFNHASIAKDDYYQNVSLEAKPDNFLNLYLIEDKSFLLRTVSQEESSDGFLADPIGKNQIITYTVKSGDNLGKIANLFGINVDTIKLANSLQKTVLTPGQELMILPISGIYYEVKKGDTLSDLALKYKISASLIREYNNLEDNSLKIGQKIILPGARQIASNTQIASSSTANTSTTGFKVDNSTNSNSNYFIYPTTGWNWGEAHGIDNRAVDIANACGTPIYASASGIVIEAKTSGYNGGYGLYLKIQHDNGTATLYAHLSSLSVANGQYVNQGQVIGKMGTTGRSTGCHLHFEVIGARNPFIKR